MPWKETCAVEERMRFVIDYLDGKLTMSDLCRLYGVSRQNAYKWIRRYQTEGPAGLLEKSRRPHGNSQAVGSFMEEIIVSARLDHPTWGPRKLKAWLIDRYPRLDFPAASTMGEVLQRRQLVAPRRRVHRTAASQPFAQCSGPNSVWCADFKGHFKVGNGDRCHPLTITDAHSRYLIRCTGLRREGYRQARPIFEEAFREYGLPLAIRTDNGPPFATVAPGGLSRLAVWWLKLGVSPERIRPGKPQENGRHERMHRTLKAETARPPQADLMSQQQAFDRFRQQFNHERPHEALDQRRPAEIFVSSPRIYQEIVGDPVYPGHFELRRVRAQGQMKWKSGDIWISEALAGELLGLTEIDDGIWLVHFAHLPIGLLDEANKRLRPLPAQAKLSPMCPV